MNIDGLFFDGSWESILKLDLAIRFSQVIGVSERIFYETDETPHLLPITSEDESELTAYKVIIAVGLAYDAKDAIKRTRFKQIDEATSLAEIQAIKWEA